MAEKGLFINSTGQGFTVSGRNNNFFPDNATLAYPANSVILITDESDMATFRSASNYDVLFSALIKDININGERVTKDNIIEKFNEAANKPMSNPGAFTSVQYDGKSELKFYNDKGVEVANVDVTPFIKDGMVEDVEISEGNLVIHFNTDSDIKDIYIPLTEIFDPEAYYTKQEIDSQVNDILDTIDEKEEVIANALTEVKQDIDEKEEVISTSLNTLNEDVENLSNNKADASALTAHIDNTNVHFTGTQKSNYDGLEGQYYIEDSWDIMSQSAFNDFTNDYSTAMGQFDQRITANANAIATKANASDVYTKTESDAKYATQVVVNEEIASRIEAIRDVNTALQSKADKSDTYTKTQVDTAMASKANTADLATVATSGSYNDLSDKPVIPESVTVDTALSDTSENPVQNKVVKGAIDEAKAYYVDFAAMSVQGITDADWDGLVAAINAHRPILVKVSASNGYVNATSSLISDNVIYITGADGNYASTYTFTKNGSNDYSVSTSTKEFVSQSEKTAWNAKQDAISDLATIRSGAALGATAYQKPSTGIPASDIEDGVIPTVPTNVSAFTNDAGYLTQHQSLADYYTKTETDNAIATAMEDIDLSDYVDVTTFNKKELATAKALTQLNDTKADKTELPDVSTLATKTELNAKANSADLATVATSGSYNDLTDKPVIPEGVYYVDFAALSTQGITDADWDGLVNAINAHRPIYAGLPGENGLLYYTAECLYQDGSNIIRMTASDHNSHYFYLFTKRGTNDYTMTYEVRPYVTEVEKHNWSAKQDALISGTNIKTINNQSIIGAGNIDIQFTQTQADWNETDTTSSAFIKNKPDLSGKVNGLGGITNIQNIVSREYEHRKYIGTINSNTLYVVKPTEWEVVADDGNGTFEFTTGDSQQQTSQFLSEISSASLQTLSESYRGSDGYEGYTVTFADLVTGETYTATPHTDSGASVIIFNATIDGETVTIAMQIDTSNYTLSGMTLDSQSQRYLEISFQYNA